MEARADAQAVEIKGPQRGGICDNTESRDGCYRNKGAAEWTGPAIIRSGRGIVYTKYGPTEGGGGPVTIDGRRPGPYERRVKAVT